MKLTLGDESIWYLFIRYVLGLIMLVYGLVKILGLQFPSSISLYASQANELDGATLAWIFLGFSPWFSVLLGIVEFVTAILLLFKKTKLLGAVVLLPTLVTIVLINNAYGLETSLRIFTAVLLVMNLILIAPFYKKTLNIFKELILYQSTTKLSEVIINSVVVVLITFFIVYIFKRFL
ncbi:hypothetical protein GXP67_02720 [Rhodocytophaga rosea]|uniref:DoxX family membrane protein n=1 Tax=Rhodocytophaga rosea TaxID=2704465 RepID=A0A6C0GCT0_9BACT|nr:hypothetical protein [Rhodocytophaga rosea]QHT65654.1 hypothetical protein GXP67_02720 [Rhodocytophaga rosea]